MELITIDQARRLALARAGLLKPEWTGIPTAGRGEGAGARNSCLEIIRHFGYLQLDTVTVSGARSHALVLMSRLPHAAPILGETLLEPGAPLFEYWGHEVSWMPIESYPLFEFRRESFRSHPWWGDLVGKHPKVADAVLDKIAREGPLESQGLDSEEIGGGKGGGGWWNFSLAKKIATALWSSGELAIARRRSFRRSFDITERVIPARHRKQKLSEQDAITRLLEKALEGHGWATTATLAATWRLRNLRPQIAHALQELESDGRIVPAAVDDANGKPIRGWIRPDDLELASRLARCRPRADQGVLLSPFDPVLWDRSRVKLLFGFDQVLEIYKPEPQRVYGYYCLPVLAGDQLIGRVDLKADRSQQTLHILAQHFGPNSPSITPTPEQHTALTSAIQRHAQLLQLTSKLPGQ